MDPRRKASLLWGLTGVLTFLVLVQAYHVAVGEILPLSVVLGSALLVGVVTTASAHLLRPRVKQFAR